MIHQPTLEKLQTLKLSGMVAALQEQLRMPDVSELGFEDRLGLLVDRELTNRSARRLNVRLQHARLRQAACLEDIDFHHTRGLDKTLMLTLAGCQWISDHQNILITGPTGAGKSYLACALAQKSCREGYAALYYRCSRLFHDLAMARIDGSYTKLLKTLAKAQVLILDDWGLAPLVDEQRRDLFEVIEDRYQSKSTVVAAQVPQDHWHKLIGDPTLADAILDRLVHNAYKIQLKGGSMRKKIGSATLQS